jgi:tyrosine-protein phosphatase YwqE
MAAVPIWKRDAERDPLLTAADVRFDVHSHLLPGVDDGPADVDLACDCLQLLVDQGYAGAVLTPHINPPLFDNDESALRGRFEAFRREIPGAAGRLEDGDGLRGFRLALAAEYMLNERFLERLYGDASTLLSFGPGGLFVLVELPPAVEPANMDDMLGQFQRQRRVPVIAHVERYEFIAADRGPDRLRAWREQGALVQVNIGSLVGQYGRAIQKVARRVWQATLVDIIGTDMHRPDRAITALPDAWDWIAANPCGFDPRTQAQAIDQVPLP